MARFLILLFLTALFAATTGCVSRDQYVRAENTIDRQDEVISSYEQQFGGMKAELDDLRSRVKRQDAELAKARSSANALRDANQSLEEQYAQIRETYGQDLPLGVNVQQVADGVAFQVEGAVLFDSGKTELREGGKDTLLDLIARIRDGVEPIRVEGHTDSDPVTSTRHLYPLGNLQLSGQRALNVADFLRTHGVSPERIYYAGMGQHHPRSDNSTPEGKAQNRRVEIVLVTQPQN